MRIEISLMNENGISFCSDNFPAPINTVAKNEYHNMGRVLNGKEDLTVTICFTSLKEELRVPVKVLGNEKMNQVKQIVIDGVVVYELPKEDPTEENFSGGFSFAPIEESV